MNVFVVRTTGHRVLQSSNLINKSKITVYFMTHLMQHFVLQHWVWALKYSRYLSCLVLYKQSNSNHLAFSAIMIKPSILLGSKIIKIPYNKGHCNQWNSVFYETKGNAP